MFKRMIVFVFAGALLFSALGGELVVVRIAPPRVVIEHRDQRPSQNHVWISGYHRYENNAYVWTPGQWQLPPRPHDRWVANRWTHRKDGWVFVEGHWRS